VVAYLAAAKIGSFIRKRENPHSRVKNPPLSLVLPFDTSMDLRKMVAAYLAAARIGLL
jgi:hypothetical protein